MWDVNDRRGTLTSHRRVRTFLQSPVTAEKLVIRARDSEDHPFDITFRLTDVRPAVEQVLRTCAGKRRGILTPRTSALATIRRAGHDTTEDRGLCRAEPDAQLTVMAQPLHRAICASTSGRSPLIYRSPLFNPTETFVQAHAAPD